MSQIGNTTIHTEMTLGTTQVVQGAAQAKVAVEGFKKAAEAPAAQQGVFESITLGAKAALKPIADVFSLITRSLGIISLITAGVGTLILVVNNLTSAWDRQEKKIKDSEKAVDAYKAKIGTVFLTGEEKRVAEIEARYRELGESIRNDDKLTSAAKNKLMVEAFDARDEEIKTITQRERDALREKFRVELQVQQDKTKQAAKDIEEQKRKETSEALDAAIEIAFKNIEESEIRHQKELENIKKERDAKIDAINDVANALRALQAEQTSGFGLSGLGTIGALGAVGQGAGAANLFARRIGR